MRLGERRDRAVTEKENTCKAPGRETKTRPVVGRREQDGESKGRAGPAQAGGGGQGLDATGPSRHDKKLRLCSMCFGKP